MLQHIIYANYLFTELQRNSPKKTYKNVTLMLTRSQNFESTRSLFTHAQRRHVGLFLRTQIGPKQNSNRTQIGLVTQIELVLRTRAILRSLKNSLVRDFSKLHSKSCYYVYLKFEIHSTKIWRALTNLPNHTLII